MYVSAAARNNAQCLVSACLPHCALRLPPTTERENSQIDTPVAVVTVAALAVVVRPSASEDAY